MSTEIILEILQDFKWLTTSAVFTDYHSSYRNLRRYLRYGRPQHLKEGAAVNLEKKSVRGFIIFFISLKTRIY